MRPGEQVIYFALRPPPETAERLVRLRAAVRRRLGLTGAEVAARVTERAGYVPADAESDRRSRD